MVSGKPDELGHQILHVLQSNARMDVAQLAAQVHRSPTPVHLRIRKLEEAGFIRDYIALLDRKLLGRPVLVVAHIKLKKQTGKLLERFEGHANGMPEVQFCLQVSGH
jgi:DNA-binding Lrp family transcriptional regulator